MTEQDEPKELARYQPCGCQVCVCETDDYCLGCGAKNCGNHPFGEIPNPVYTTRPARAAGVPDDWRSVIQRAIQHIETQPHAHIACDTMVNELRELLAATPEPKP